MKRVKLTSKTFKRRKGALPDYVMIGVFLGTLILAVIIYAAFSQFAANNEFQLRAEFQAARTDQLMASVRELMLQPALDYSMPSVANFLARWGGINKDAGGTNPDIKRDSGNVAFWYVVKDVDSEKIEPRIPFTYWYDSGKTIKGGETYSVKIHKSSDLVNVSEITIMAYVFEPTPDNPSPSIKVSCKGCDSFAGSDITRAGGFSYTFPAMIKAGSDAELTFVGVGAADKPAGAIRQIMASSYTKADSLVNSFMSTLVGYYKSVFLAVLPHVFSNAAVTFDQPGATFAALGEPTDKNAGWVTSSTAYAPSGISAEYKISDRNSAVVKSSGFANSSVPLRYWLLYDIAKKAAEEWKTDPQWQAGIRQKAKVALQSTADLLSYTNNACGSFPSQADAATTINKNFRPDGTAYIKDVVRNAISQDVTNFAAAIKSKYAANDNDISVKAELVVKDPQTKTVWESVSGPGDPQHSTGSCCRYTTKTTCSGDSCTCTVECADYFKFTTATWSYVYRVQFHITLNLTDARARFVSLPSSPPSDALTFLMNLEDVSVDLDAAGKAASFSDPAVSPQPPTC